MDCRDAPTDVSGVPREECRGQRQASCQEPATLRKYSGPVETTLRSAPVNKVAHGDLRKGGADRTRGMVAGAGLPTPDATGDQTSRYNGTGEGGSSEAKHCTTTASSCKPTHMQGGSAHRIALVNFSPADAARLSRAGFHAELCFFATSSSLRAEGMVALLLSFPRPVYEFDVYVYNGSPLPEAERAFQSLKQFTEGAPIVAALNQFNTPPSIRIVFVGPECERGLGLAGVPFMKANRAHGGVSMIEFVGGEPGLNSPELERCVADLQSSIAIPVQYSVHIPDPPGHPFHHFPLLASRNKDLLAVYGTVYKDGVLPVYIVLPQFKDNTEALIRVLQMLAETNPELFPDVPRKKAWLCTKQFAFREEVEIDSQIEAALSEVEQLVEAKKAEKLLAAKEFDFIRKILIATEDLEVDKQDRLSTNVKRTLEYLGFTVRDIDEAIQNAIRKEDFWVSDGPFLAITEVTATRRKNPKNKEYNDLLGRMTTVLKRHDLVPEVTNPTGLLVLNYDIETHPFRRPRAYTGDAEEIALAAKEYGIGLLSTVDLHRIAVAVKNGAISKEAARSILQQAGRIEFPATPASAEEETQRAR